MTVQTRQRRHFIDCGRGALIAHAAQRFGARATGITLSSQQFEYARDRIAAEGLADRVEVLLLDYRDLPARFGAASIDKATSVGMFEHVGLRQLPEYFGIVAAVLCDRGLFLNHGITSSDVENRPVGGGASEFIENTCFRTANCRMCRWPCVRCPRRASKLWTWRACGRITC